MKLLLNDILKCCMIFINKNKFCYLVTDTKIKENNQYLIIRIYDKI